MNCPYESNVFCARLPEETRRTLCAHCHLRKYAKGQRMNYRYFENLVAVQLDGLIVLGNPDPKNNGKFITNGIAAGGLLSAGKLYAENWEEPTVDRDALCLFDCTIAVIDQDIAQALFDQDLAFVKAIYNDLMSHCCHEKQRFFMSVGGRDAYEAVRYVIDFCRRKGVPPLTHEQIALLSNRSRPTVTEMMHLLLQKEPELFQPLEQ